MANLVADYRLGAGQSSYKCSDCGCLFEAPSPPRGARPWTAEEARVKVDSAFREHAQRCHTSQPRRARDGVTIPLRNRVDPASSGEVGSCATP